MAVGASIHHLDVPSQMKACDDQIVRARRTFGLMTTCSTPCYNRRRSDLGHDADEMLEALGDRGWSFHQAAFRTVTTE